MSIRDWPKTEQPREKLLHGNPATLSDAEILAIFIRTGAAGKSAIDLARELLERYKGLKGILEADMTSFCQGKGLGTAKYVQLQAALELGRRYLQSKLTREYALNDPKDTAAFLKSRLCGYQHEVFACLFLDNRHRLICFEELFTGTIDGASVHPREVVKRALFHNAAALIFAHNHPSGIAEPSQADQNITQQLKKSLSLVDIRVLDHFVIGENEPVSFAERGLI